MSQNPYSPPAAAVADRAEVHLKRPAAVTVGIVLLGVLVLMKVAGVLYAISSVTIGLHDDRLRTLLIVAQVVILLYGAIALVFLWAAGRGWNWGRVALAVFTVLETLLMYSMRDRVLLDSTAASIGYSLPSLLPVVAVLVLFTPLANRWYAAKRPA